MNKKERLLKKWAYYEELALEILDTPYSFTEVDPKYEIMKTLALIDIVKGNKHDR